MPRIVSRVHHPVLRLLGGVEQPLESHLRRSLWRLEAQRCTYKRPDKQYCGRREISHQSLHCAPPFSLAASRNAMRSLKSFSGRLLASYAGIKDSRVFSNDRSLAFSNECSSSGVTTVAVSYSCEKSFIGSDSPVASRLLGLRTDSARYSRDRDVPVELRSGPSRPPLPLTMWQVPQAALP